MASRQYSSVSAAAGQSTCDRNSGDWFQKVWYTAPESGWPLDSSWQCYYMPGTTTKLHVNAILSSWVVVALKSPLGLGLTVTEINTKETRLNKT